MDCSFFYWHITWLEGVMVVGWIYFSLFYLVSRAIIMIYTAITYSLWCIAQQYYGLISQIGEGEINAMHAKTQSVLQKHLFFENRLIQRFMDILIFPLRFLFIYWAMFSSCFFTCYRFSVLFTPMFGFIIYRLSSSMFCFYSYFIQLQRTFLLFL